MIYRATCTLAFTDIKHARKSLETVKAMFINAITINPGQVNEEKSFYTLEECQHGGGLPFPCTTLEHEETA